MSADSHEAAGDADLLRAFLVLGEMRILLLDFRSMMVYGIAMAERGHPHVRKCLHLLAADFKHLVFVLCGLLGLILI